MAPMARLTGCIGALALLAACGGKVVFIEGGGGAPGTATGSSTSAVSTGGPDPACEALCHSPQCDDHPSQCVAQCDATLPGCEAEGEAFLVCAAANLEPSSCALHGWNASSGIACTGERLEFLTCRYAEHHCVGPASGCDVSPDHTQDCHTSCDFGELGAHCAAPDVEGKLLCECTINGAVVATCKGFVFDPDEPDCCEPTFFGLDDFIDTSAISE